MKRPDDLFYKQKIIADDETTSSTVAIYLQPLICLVQLQFGCYLNGASNFRGGISYPSAVVPIFNNDGIVIEDLINIVACCFSNGAMVTMLCPEC